MEAHTADKAAAALNLPYEGVLLRVALNVSAVGVHTGD